MRVFWSVVILIPPLVACVFDHELGIEDSPSAGESARQEGRTSEAHLSVGFGAGSLGASPACRRDTRGRKGDDPGPAVSSLRSHQKWSPRPDQLRLPGTGPVGLLECSLPCSGGGEQVGREGKGASILVSSPALWPGFL